MQPVSSSRTHCAHFKAAVDGFFANIASYRDEIQTLISGAFHYIG
jgi:hypothetical protein